MFEENRRIKKFFFRGTTNLIVVHIFHSGIHIQQQTTTNVYNRKQIVPNRVHNISHSRFAVSSQSGLIVLTVNIKI